MTRANAIAFPFLMDQPIAGRVAKLRPDDAERFARDELRFAKQTDALGRG